MEDFQDLKNKGFKYHQENNLDNAERCYKKALKINSKNAEAHNLLGLVKLQQNNFEEAIDCFFCLGRIGVEYITVLSSER